MTRYYLEVRYQVTPVAAVDEHTDAMMDALDAEPNLIDADMGANLRHGWADVCAVVEGEDEASALRTGLVAVRSAARSAGETTAGWEADLCKVTATVRPAELAESYISTQSTDYLLEPDISPPPRTPPDDQIPIQKAEAIKRD